MFKFTYETQSFETTFALPEASLFSQDCIIELDLLNDLAPKWVYAEGKPCVIGILHENRIIVCVAETEDDEEFKNEVWNILHEKAQIAKFYALNWLYVRDVLKSLFNGFEFPIHELSPINGQGWTRDKRYQVLRTYRILKGDKEIYDNYCSDAKKSVADWKKWLADGDQQHLMDIVQNVLGNLCKLALIHKHREWYSQQFHLDKDLFERRARK